MNVIRKTNAAWCAAVQRQCVTLRVPIPHPPWGLIVAIAVINGNLWRWGESNPRPMAGPEFFSERSLRFYFSAPSIA